LATDSHSELQSTNIFLINSVPGQRTVISLKGRAIFEFQLHDVGWKCDLQTVYFTSHGGWTPTLELYKDETYWDSMCWDISSSAWSNETFSISLALGRTRLSMKTNKKRGQVKKMMNCVPFLEGKLTHLITRQEHEIYNDHIKDMGMVQLPNFLMDIAVFKDPEGEHRILDGDCYNKVGKPNRNGFGSYQCDNLKDCNCVYDMEFLPNMFWKTCFQKFHETANFHMADLNPFADFTLKDYEVCTDHYESQDCSKPESSLYRDSRFQINKETIKQSLISERVKVLIQGPTLETFKLNGSDCNVISAEWIGHDMDEGSSFIKLTTDSDRSEISASTGFGSWKACSVVKFNCLIPEHGVVKRLSWTCGANEGVIYVKGNLQHRGLLRDSHEKLMTFLEDHTADTGDFNMNMNLWLKGLIGDGLFSSLFKGFTLSSWTVIYIVLGLAILKRIL